MTPCSILHTGSGTAVLTWQSTGWHVRNWLRVSPGHYTAEIRGADHLAWLPLEIDARDPEAAWLAVDGVRHPLFGWRVDAGWKLATFRLGEPEGDGWTEEFGDLLAVGVSAG